MELILNFKCVMSCVSKKIRALIFLVLGFFGGVFLHFRLEISSTEIELVRKIAEQAGLKSVTPGVCEGESAGCTAVRSVGEGSKAAPG